MKTIFNSALTDSFEKDVEGVGSIRVEGNKVYKFVKFDNGTGNIAAAAGNAVGYLKATGYSTSTVTCDVSDTDNIVAGALLAVVPDGYYCWVQIQGAATLAVALDDAPADGGPLVMGTTDAALGKAAVSGNAEASLAVCGLAEDASEKKVILNCVR
jgi:hypothetical protein